MYIYCDGSVVTVNGLPQCSGEWVQLTSTALAADLNTQLPVMTKDDFLELSGITIAMMTLAFGVRLVAKTLLVNTSKES